MAIRQEHLPSLFLEKPANLRRPRPRGKRVTWETLREQKRGK